MEPTRVSHYELRRLLGRGGMGEVYEALDLKARRAVALKFIAPELAADPDSFRRFEAEAHNAAALHHPHIATLFEFEPEGERPFIAMELVGGQSLRERLRSGALPLAEALIVARDVASALAYAHRRNIVHRDIKPENLMFDEEGRTKVMDFGLARAMLASRLTTTGTTLGTPSYMSPEAVAGRTGPPGDVFALGLVVHEMLTGNQVFTGESPLSVMFAIANTDAPPLRSQLPDLPQDVEDVVRGLLERDAGKRIDAATAARELARLTGSPLPALESAMRTPAATVDVEARTMEIASGPRTTQTTQPILTPGGTNPSTAATEVIQPERRRLNPALLVAVAFVMSGLGLGAWGMLTWQRSGGAKKHQQAVFLNNQAVAVLDSSRTADQESRPDLLIRAQSLAVAALARDPRYDAARLNLGTILDARGQVDSAMAVLGQVAQRKNQDPKVLAMALYNMGDIDLRSGAADQALTRLRRSFDLDSSSAPAYNMLGLALIQAHQANEALPLLERGAARFPGAAPLEKNAGFAAMELQDDAKALMHLSQAIAADSDYGPAYGLRARVRAKLGDRTGALTDWRSFLASHPVDAERADVERALAQLGVAVTTP
jgi:Tfp pilus assembly protein PilF